MKPSELIRLWANSPMYNPERLCKPGDEYYYGSAYLCCVVTYGSLPEGVTGEQVCAAHEQIELQLAREEVIYDKPTRVLAHVFEYRGVTQTLENSREYWEHFAASLEKQGQ